MKDFVQLLKTLNISSLRDIGKRIGVRKFEKSDIHIDERDYYSKAILAWQKSKIKFYDKIWFRLMIPLLVASTFFAIGNYSDISNESLKSEILGNGIPEVIFFMGMPVDSVKADFNRKFPGVEPPLTMINQRHGSMILHSFNEKYPIYDAKISVARSHDNTGVVLAEKTFGTISEPEHWYIQSSMYQERMNSKIFKPSSKFKLSHPNLSADEILNYSISTRNGAFEQQDYFRLSETQYTYLIASRTFLKRIINGKYEYILVRESIDPEYPRDTNGNIIDFNWNEDIMVLSEDFKHNYDSLLTIFRQD